MRKPTGREVAIVSAWIVGVALAAINTLSNVQTAETLLPQSVRGYLPLLTIVAFSIALVLTRTHQPVDGVVYRENIEHRKTIERQQQQLGEQSRQIGRLTTRISELGAAHDAIKPRIYDKILLLSAANALRDSVGDDLRKHAIRIYPVPIIHDSAVVANQIKQALESIKLHPEIDTNGPERSEYPFLEFGAWVIGDANRNVERGLADMLGVLGLPVSVVDVVQTPKHTPYSGFEILIAIGGDDPSGAAEGFQRGYARYRATSAK